MRAGRADHPVPLAVLSAGTVRAARPAGRLADPAARHRRGLWEPLVIVADLAGGHCPARSTDDQQQAGVNEPLTRLRPRLPPPQRDR
ncbi:DUF3631 domain-containing protein [Streptomyces sp. NPDC058653]|uniref:DUF3631 domain-containing protein n=1 Tax=Streptomyces sp. NPDC058653 TaxID=3346576 RepID=UPI0036601D93